MLGNKGSQTTYMQNLYEVINSKDFLRYQALGKILKIVKVLVKEPVYKKYNTPEELKGFCTCKAFIL